MTLQNLKDRFNAATSYITGLTAPQAGKLLAWHAAGLFVLNDILLKHPPMDPVKLTLLEMALPALLALQGGLTGALVGNTASSFRKRDDAAPSPASSLREYFGRQADSAKQALREMKNPAKIGAFLCYAAGAALSIGMSFTPGK